MVERTLTVHRTSYPGKLRDYGKTKESLRTVACPRGASEGIVVLETAVSRSCAGGIYFPQCAQTQRSRTERLIRTDNYRARVLRPLAQKLGLAKLNFQLLRRTMARLAQTKGSVKDVQGLCWDTAQPTRPRSSTCSPIEASIKQMQEAIFAELAAGPKLVGEVPRTEKIWYALVGGCFGRSASDCPARVGRLTQR